MCNAACNSCSVVSCIQYLCNSKITNFNAVYSVSWRWGCKPESRGIDEQIRLWTHQLVFDPTTWYPSQTIKISSEKEVSERHATSLQEFMALFHWCLNRVQAGHCFPLTALEAAISSKRFQVVSCFLLISSIFASSSWNLSKHSSTSSGSASEKIFRMFSDKLWTAWFQWLRPFFSKAGKIMGSMTLRFCLIKFSICSLFHKNKALSATCRSKSIIQHNILVQEGSDWAHHLYSSETKLWSQFWLIIIFSIRSS